MRISNKKNRKIEVNRVTWIFHTKNGSKSQCFQRMRCQWCFRGYSPNWTLFKILMCGKCSYRKRICLQVFGECFSNKVFLAFFRRQKIVAVPNIWFTNNVRVHATTEEWILLHSVIIRHFIIPSPKHRNLLEFLQFNKMIAINSGDAHGKSGIDVVFIQQECGICWRWRFMCFYGEIYRSNIKEISRAHRHVS